MKRARWSSVAPAGLGPRANTSHSSRRSHPGRSAASGLAGLDLGSVHLPSVHLPGAPARRRRGRRLLSTSGTALALVVAAVGVYALSRRITSLLTKPAAESTERGLDTLTGLPNRAEAQWWLNTRLTRARNRNHRLAVMILDLNGFADLNEIHGREVGDHVLQVTAARMQSQLRTGDMVCRIANDTFMVIMDAIGPDHLIARIGERVVTTVSEPVSFHGEPVTISASVGFAISQDKDKTPDLLLDRADRALVQAKASNRNVVQF